MTWDNQVAEEDVSLVQSVQRGLDSGAVPGGTPRARQASPLQVVDEAVARLFERFVDPARAG